MALSMTPFFPPLDVQRDLLSLWSAGSAHDTAMTILMGTLVAVACGWLGCWLILQGLALIGDAISHTVLLGIVLALLLTGEVAGTGMFIAATITGLVTVVLIDALHTSSRLKEDAAIGIVFSALFALGVVLLGVFAGRAHIDTGHVLYGNLEFVTSGRQVSIVGVEVPVPVCQMAAVVAALFTLIVVFYKELLLVAFDAPLAASLGWRPVRWRYGLLAALSVTVVGSFQAVGAILVVAMLIAPAATAYLLAKRLPAMFPLSTIAAVLSSFLGFHLSYWLDVSAASAIACVACGLFGLAFLFAPEQGVLAILARRVRRKQRANCENVLRRLWKLSAGRTDRAVPAFVVSAGMNLPAWQFAWSVRTLMGRGWIESPAADRSALRLAQPGARQAQRLDRAHRLWETYLVDTVGLASDHVHPAAEEVEHVLSEQLIERLDDALGHPETDPHGAPIPRSPVNDLAPGTFALSKLRAGDAGRISGLLEGGDHVAGEAAGDGRLAEVARLGLTLGQRITVVGRAMTGDSVAGDCWSVQLEKGGLHHISHALADSILVRLESSAADVPETQAP